MSYKFMVADGNGVDPPSLLIRTLFSMRQDIPLLRRAEEGLGDSLSLPDFLVSQSGTNESSSPSKHGRLEDTQKSPEPLMPSHPSPPVSGPAPDVIGGFEESSPVPDSALPARQFLRSLSFSPVISTQESNDQPSHTPKNGSPPSFGSLSSPIASPEEMILDPPTPPFELLVANAINATKQQTDVHPQTPPASLLNPECNQGLQSSTSSSTSQDSVENKLTQSMDVDEDKADKDLLAEESQRSGFPTVRMAPQILNEQIPRRRQSWYGILPPRRSSGKSLGMVASEIGGNLRAIHSTPSQLSKGTTATSPPFEHAFRSGTLQLSPSSHNQDPVAYSQPQISPTQSQFEARESSLEYVEPYALQTQAPVQHILAESTTNVPVECIVFPAYETKGELNEAVDRFADWLTTLTIEKEVASGGGAGTANIVLCGHRRMIPYLNSTTPDQIRPPHFGRKSSRALLSTLLQDSFIIYLGIHPHVFKNGVTKASEYANAAQTVGSAVFGAIAGLGAKKATTTTTSQPAAVSSGSSWSSWAAPAAFAIGGAVLAGAAAGSAYLKRDEIGTSFSWATDHLKFVGNLWDEAALSGRIEALVTMKEKAGVTFHAFYSMIPATPPFSVARMFIVLPKRSSPQYACFSPAQNTKALDEVQAHIGMFGAKSNDGYYELGLATAKVIRESLPPTRINLDPTNPWNEI
ncbi:hypothetical protein H0H92_010992 [Tricholoma furcatifolium]|nr:hypothetical protein H0H92_010992 [Tricholoma furcatifolium]